MNPIHTSSDYEVTLMTEADIPGAIDAIQQAFTDDPYNKWIYNDRSKVFLTLLHPPHPRTSPNPNDQTRSSTLSATGTL